MKKKPNPSLTKELFTTALDGDPEAQNEIVAMGVSDRLIGALLEALADQKKKIAELEERAESIHDWSWKHCYEEHD